ncbi:hypothetical protein D8Y22_20420 [Salinadaptatus halalkaliphilus]|uniref:Uncharacterized protein n=1 Tax=Salinadaptatus halalkaliphilus TaxID=2419781 RepID=A0A4S3TFY8_9EURY|nr:hypothetical protein D8Y22_20420 [Salinadaptatus halalkaliphilus]
MTYSKPYDTERKIGIGDGLPPRGLLLPFLFLLTVSFLLVFGLKSSFDEGLFPAFFGFLESLVDTLLDPFTEGLLVVLFVLVFLLRLFVAAFASFLFVSPLFVTVFLAPLLFPVVVVVPFGLGFLLGLGFPPSVILLSAAVSSVLFVLGSSALAVFTRGRGSDAPD